MNYRLVIGFDDVSESNLWDFLAFFAIILVFTVADSIHEETCVEYPSIMGSPFSIPIGPLYYYKK